MTKKLDIEFPRDFYLDDVGVWRLKKEKITELEASNVQTNEEYLRSLNTEQLADLMSRMLDCSNCPIPKDGRSCMGTYSGCWHEIIKWLKQPHSEVAE